MVLLRVWCVLDMEDRQECIPSYLGEVMQDVRQRSSWTCLG